MFPKASSIAKGYIVEFREDYDKNKWTPLVQFILEDDDLELVKHD